MVNAFDSSLAKLPICGATASYFQSLAVDNSQGNTAFRGGAATGPSSFPANAKVRCGKFELYYEDLLPGNPAAGFGDPTSGLIRRNTLCAVLTYVQGIVNFSNIPANKPIRIQVLQSYSTQNPAPLNTQFYAFAGPFRALNATTPVGGFVRDYTVSGTDPAPGFFHAQMKVNFDQIVDANGYGSPIFWQDDATSALAKCKLDLYSVLLHERTHFMGWISLIDYASSNMPNANGPFSRMDNSIHIGNPNRIAGGPNPLPLTKLINNNILNTSYAPGGDMWLDGTAPPENVPVFSGEPLALLPMMNGSNTAPYKSSFVSHLDDLPMNWPVRNRVSPGEQFRFVMSPFGLNGISKREYTKHEVKALGSILGYSYTSSYSSSNAIMLANKVPYSTRMIGAAMNNYFPIWENNQPDKVTPDFTITNNGTPLTINVGTRPEFIDPDGDPKSVKPGSLINFRGCGNGGNNHNQLSVSPNGQIITYTPRPNFVGLAQFGFTLWDGKEKGTFVLYTIKVNAGTNITLPTSGEMVLNGGFEEGTEVTRFGADESIDNTTVADIYIGKLQNIHFSDSHPADWLSNVLGFSGGIYINNTSRNCGSTFLSTTTYSYGDATNSCTPVGSQWLMQPPVEMLNGERYKALRTSHAFLKLVKHVLPNMNYVLEFDAYDASNNGMAPIGGISFTTEATANLNTLNRQQSLSPSTVHDITSFTSIISGTGVWKHFIINLVYSGTTPADILVIQAKLQGTPPYISYPYSYIDNVSLKLGPPCDPTTPAVVLREVMTTPSGYNLPATATALLAYFGNPTNNTVTTTLPIIIDGKFKVDKNIVFSGSTIRFANPAVAASFSGMEVNAGKSLTINNCTLQAGCGNMWAGIDVPANAGNITISNSTVRDMYQGIKVVGNVPAIFTGNQFKDNVYGIRLSQNTLSHNLTINGNTFSTTSANLLPPFAGQKGEVGIYTLNCQKLPIGPNVSSATASNTFDNLKTGIYIDINNIPNTIAIDYKLFNNDFKNITGGDFGTLRNGVRFTDLYSDDDGTAIFVKNVAKSTNAASLLQIGYLGSNTASITNCTKAVTVSNLSVSAGNTKIQDGVWGFSLGRPEAGNYTLSGNQITNIYRGIDFNGTPGSATVTANNYKSPVSGNFQFNGYPVGNGNGDPVGISLSNFSQLSTNRVLLKENTLIIRSVGGTGMVLQNTGNGVLLDRNTIDLITSSQGAPGGRDVLLGVSLNNCNGTALMNNQVTGNPSLNIPNNPTVITQRDNVAGFLIARSPRLTIQMNQIKHLKYGFLTIDDCVTDPKAVAGNCFYGHRNGMLFRQLGGNPGTFGDIGDPRTDNNNQFNGSYYTTQGGSLMKVFRTITSCNNNQPIIFTRPPALGGTIALSESGSNVPGCWYDVRPNFSNPVVSPACIIRVPAGRPGGGDPEMQLYDTSGAVAVAKDSVVYPYFADVAKWMADKELYEILSRDADARAARAEFATFYAQKDATLFKYVQNADSLLAGLSDSAIRSDEATWQQWLADAKVENSAIVSTEVQEEAENLINDAYMRYLEGGFDTLNNTTDSTLIASLALSCPYVNGTAVYKARMLYSYWAPAETYTDLEICNAVGVYKGGKNPLAEENELLNSFEFAPEDGKVSLLEKNKQGIVISPNPGTGLFTLEVVGAKLKEGVLDVYNLLGQKVQTVWLKDNSSTQFNLTGNPAGVYYYQCRDTGVVIASGKLVLKP